MDIVGLVCLYGFTTFDDIRTKQVKVIEILIFGIIGIIFNIIYRPNTLASLLGGIGIGLLVLLFSFLTNEKIGKGDAYIIMVTGLYLGFMNTAVLLWLSSVYAAIGGILIYRIYDMKKDKELPFVPFLLAGYLTLLAIHTLGGIAL